MSETSIFLDKESGEWKVKTLGNGKDKRVTIRKALPIAPGTPAS